MAVRFDTDHSDISAEMRTAELMQYVERRVPDAPLEMQPCSTMSTNHTKKKKRLVKLTYR
jgi:hypothetical protein